MKTQEKTDAYHAIHAKVMYYLHALFPSMPTICRNQIADHSTQPNTFRIFATDDAGSIPKITPQLVTRAVKSYVRHKMTDYDSMCVFNKRGWVKRQIHPIIKSILAEWRQPKQP